MKAHKFNSGGGYDTVVVFCEFCGLVAYDNGLTIDENLVLQAEASKGCACNEGYLVPATLESINPLENFQYTPNPIPGTDKLKEFFNAGEKIYAGDLVPGENKTRPLPATPGPGKPGKKPTYKYFDTIGEGVEVGQDIFAPEKGENGYEIVLRSYARNANYLYGFYVNRLNAESAVLDLKREDLL